MITLLRLLAHDPVGYAKVQSLVKVNTLEEHSKNLLTYLEKYYEEHKITELDFKVFSEIFLSEKKHQKDKEVYVQLIKNMKTPLTESVKNCVVNQLIQANVASALTDSLYRWEAGEEIDLLEEIKREVESAEQGIELHSDEDAFALIDELVNTNTEEKTGFKWHLDVLNEHLRELQGGDDLIVAARPDKGKTTFLAQLACCIAKQTDETGVIVWLNNEGPKKRILRRVVQSSMRITESQLSQMQLDGTVNKNYAKAIGGEHKIQIYDVHGQSTSDISLKLKRISAKYKIAMIVFDMADNVRYARSRKTDRTDEVLEHLYIWVRERATEFDCITVKTSQISDPGHGVPFPSENFLKDSRTGKQGATDTILVIGHDLLEGNENVRYISVPKNKLRREGSPPLKAMVTINMDRAFYQE